MKALSTMIFMLALAGCANMDFGRSRDTSGTSSSGSAMSDSRGAGGDFGSSMSGAGGVPDTTYVGGNF